MKKLVHMCLDVRGFLQNHINDRDYTGMFKHDDGRQMSAMEARSALLDALADGKKVIPFGDECEGFSYETGCPSHPIEEKEGS